MKPVGDVSKLLGVTLVILMGAAVGNAQSLLSELQAEHNPVKRSNKALVLADMAFDNARDYYNKGEVNKGDAALENMTSALNACLQSLATAHKARFYKKAELKVSYLQRRMEGLLYDLDVQQRGWAEQTQRRLDQIHDKLLSGVMRK